MVIKKSLGNGNGNGNSSTAAKNGNHSIRWCAAQTPYPEVRVERPNLFYARLLMQDHAGITSELTAITQYLYHYQTLKAQYPEVGDLLECISQVEMHHMELLGEAIVKLGGKPKYATKVTGRYDWWRGDYVDYGHDICDQLASDIHGEHEAIAQYRKHMSIINDAHVQKLITRIIQDEEEHIKYLSAALEKHCRKRDP